MPGPSVSWKVPDASPRPSRNPFLAASQRRMLAKAITIQVQPPSRAPTNLRRPLRNTMLTLATMHHSQYLRAAALAALAGMPWHGDRSALGSALRAASIVQAQGAPIALGAHPTVTIPVGAQGASVELLDVIGATRLRSGNIAVADRGQSEIRVYDRNGRLVGSSGRRGQGPGDYMNVSRLWRTEDDTLMVYDMAQKRVSVLNEKGQYVRSWPQIGAATRVTIDGRFTDGTLLAELDIIPPPLTRTGIERRTKHLVRVRPDGSVSDTLPTPFFRGETLVFVGQRGPLGSARPPLSRYGHTEVHGDMIYFADGSDVVRQVDRQGRTAREIRRSGPATSLTAAEQDRIVAEFTSSPRMPAAFSQLLREELSGYLQRGDYARFDSMLVDATGKVWLRDTRSYLSEEREWTVLSLSGATEARIRIPRTQSILEIGADYLLVSGLNDLGDLVVQEFPLTRR